MQARAPGKVVISGAYAVLSGAPAIVSAVDRYVLADTELTPDRVTAEVEAALAGAFAPDLHPDSQPRAAPWFDASALRSDGAKLGLGSSAAILVASLAALRWSDAPTLDEQSVRQELFPKALAAHGMAQAGGSGVDVCASTFGGTLIFHRSKPELPELVTFPANSVIEIWSSGVPSSTAVFLAAFGSFSAAHPTELNRLMSPQTEASELARQALLAHDLQTLIGALCAQRRALSLLGAALSLPIVGTALARLADRAEAEGAALLPAGAGGGDIACFMGRRGPSRELRAEARSLRYVPLTLTLGARGVHRPSPP